MTEAGRRLLDAYFFEHDLDLAGGIEALVLAIEQEAVADMSARLEAAVEAWGQTLTDGSVAPWQDGSFEDQLIPRRSVLQAIAELREVTP